MLSTVNPVCQVYITIRYHIGVTLCRSLHLYHIIFDLKASETSDKTGNTAEAILFYIKGWENFLQLIMDNAQVVHMAVVLPDHACNGLFHLCFGNAGAFFLYKKSAVKLDHLEVVVVQAFQKGGKLGISVVPYIKVRKPLGEKVAHPREEIAGSWGCRLFL